MPNTTCKKCNKHLTQKQINWKSSFCSSECYRQFAFPSVEKKCEKCGKKFTTQISKTIKGHGRFCSRRCSKSNLVESTCETCGKTFITDGWTAKTKPTKYCSHECHWIGQRKDKTFTSSGYATIYQPHHPRAIKKRVYEHILVAEKALGRFLKDGETIHHINEIRDDNRPENLYLFATTGEHTAYHHTIDKTPITESNLPKYDAVP